MNSEYNIMKNTISSSLKDIELRRTNELRQVQAGKDDLEAEFTQRYKENVQKLMSTGIVKIFDEIIKNEVVILVPQRQQITEYYSFCGTKKRFVTNLPKEPAYLTWGETPKGRNLSRREDLDDPRNFKAKVSLNFDWFMIDGDDYMIPVVRHIDASYHGTDKFNLDDRDLNLDIPRGDLLQEVSQLIIRAKTSDYFTQKVDYYKKRDIYL